MKYIVLGAGGFVGRHLCQALEHSGYAPHCLAHADFSLDKTSDYSRIDFSNSIIFDCIAKVDGEDEEIYRINVVALRKFLTHLQSQENVHYVYFSTLATQLPSANFNGYARSKREAEALVSTSLHNYKIVRLSFPFGKGESPKRLISRLIQKIRSNEHLILDNTRLNLTPIAAIGDNLLAILQSTKREINFTDGKSYPLREVVDMLYELLGKTKDYSLTDRTPDISCKSSFFQGTYDIYASLQEMTDANL